MVDFKQLQCFLVCTDTGSFSEAARILYMTQSNVSKMMKALEASVGASLFVRHAKGITLTAQGKQVYQYANRIMEEVGALENFSSGKKKEWLNLSSNPSSWFADCFIEFYNEKSDMEHPIHSHVYTGSTKNIFRRLAEYQDELGFVYVLESKKDIFLYNASRHHLEFEPLTYLQATLYPGKQNPWHGKAEIELDDLETMQFVQTFQDELIEDPLWGNREEGKIGELDVAVITNSDYIMQRMLKESRLANLSGSYMNGTAHHNDHQGILLDWAENRMVYGVLKRQEDKLSKLAEEFLFYLRERIGNGYGMKQL